MGNIPSAPPAPRPVPVPVPVPIQQKRKNFRIFNDWDGKAVERIINEFLIL